MTVPLYRVGNGLAVFRHHHRHRRQIISLSLWSLFPDRIYLRNPDPVFLLQHAHVKTALCLRISARDYCRKFDRPGTHAEFGAGNRSIRSDNPVVAADPPDIGTVHSFFRKRQIKLYGPGIADIQRLSVLLHDFFCRHNSLTS